MSARGKCKEHQMSVFSPNHLFLQHVDFTLLDLQHVFEVVDLPVECALLFGDFLNLLALLIQSRLLLLQAQAQGIHLVQGKVDNSHWLELRYALKSAQKQRN